MQWGNNTSWVYFKMVPDWCILSFSYLKYVEILSFYLNWLLGKKFFVTVGWILSHLYFIGLGPLPVVESLTHKYVKNYFIDQTPRQGHNLISLTMFLKYVFSIYLDRSLSGTSGRGRGGAHLTAEFTLLLFQPTPFVSRFFFLIQQIFFFCFLL